MFFLGLWLGLTCFLDFYAVPKIFHTIGSLEEAGALGMTLFHTFNKLEVVLALSLAICAWFFRADIKWKKTFWATMMGLFSLTLVYALHMSPVIIESNTKKYQLESDTLEYRAHDLKHDQYHAMFRNTDGAKILVLFFLLGTTLRRRECAQGEEA